MVDKNDYIIGIDFGTTNSCSAMFINNKLEIIPDQLTGQKIIPSVVCYMENNEVLVGKLAEGKQTQYSQSTIFQSKRYIGHKFNDQEVQYDLQHKRMYVTIREDENTKKAKYFVKIDQNNEKYVLPEEVASEIIKYIKENAEKRLNDILHKQITLSKAVITVPAHFNDYRINAVKEAYKKANLNVVNVIKEPEAIGIAYGHLHKKKEQTKILTIDIGGGTFGMAILKIQGDKYEIIGSEGSGHLGGDDFEKSLRDYIVEQIEKDKKMNLDFSREKKWKDEKWVRVLSKIKEKTSTVISELSTKEKVKFEIKKLDGKNDFAIDISQDKYKELTKGLLVKCENKLKELFEKTDKKHKIKFKDINEIILVGGTTKAKNIQKIFEKYFDKKTIFQTLNADEAVAQGAAIYAKNLKK